MPTKRKKSLTMSDDDDSGNDNNDQFFEPLQSTQYSFLHDDLYLSSDGSDSEHGGYSDSDDDDGYQKTHHHHFNQDDDDEDDDGPPFKKKCKSKEGEEVIQKLTIPCHSVDTVMAVPLNNKTKTKKTDVTNLLGPRRSSTLTPPKKHVSDNEYMSTSNSSPSSLGSLEEEHEENDNDDDDNVGDIKHTGIATDDDDDCSDFDPDFDITPESRWWKYLVNQHTESGIKGVKDTTTTPPTTTDQSDEIQQAMTPPKKQVMTPQKFVQLLKEKQMTLQFSQPVAILQQFEEQVDNTMAAVLSSSSESSSLRETSAFYHEMKAVVSSYLSLVYIQKAIHGSNINSSAYPEEMVSKMLNIVGKIPKEDLTKEKYEAIGRDALYLYHNVITHLTGPKHSKRLRTPKKQADFCFIIAMLVNEAPIPIDLILSGKSTSLVQFASAMRDPVYRMAVNRMSCVFNHSYSVYKALNLETSMLLKADQLLSILSARNTSLTDRKPKTLAQSVFLLLDPSLRNPLRSSGLISEESSIRTLMRLVSRELAFNGISLSSLDNGCHIIHGNYISNGRSLRSIRPCIKDKKTIALATVLVEKIRSRLRTVAYH